MSNLAKSENHIVEESVEETAEEFVDKILGDVKREITLNYFPRIQLLSKELKRFELSMQASFNHYCEPKDLFTRITDYKRVEIGILPNERNSSKLFQDGRHGWLKPSDIDFANIEQYDNNDDVLAYVSLEDLKKDLVEFFKSGGCIVKESIT